MKFTKMKTLLLLWLQLIRYHGVINRPLLRSSTPSRFTFLLTVSLYEASTQFNYNNKQVISL